MKSATHYELSVYEPIPDSRMMSRLAMYAITGFSEDRSRQEQIEEVATELTGTPASETDIASIRLMRPEEIKQVNKKTLNELNHFQPITTRNGLGAIKIEQKDYYINFGKI